MNVAPTDGNPTTADFGLAAEGGKCKESDGSTITTEAECKKACNSLGNIEHFRVGKWGTPGCFFSKRNNNCHWNKRRRCRGRRGGRRCSRWSRWARRHHRAVCAPKENETIPSGGQDDGMYKTFRSMISNDYVDSLKQNNFY